MESLSIPRLAKRIPDEASAYEFLEQLRWGDEPVCPHCGVIGGHYYLKPKNGGRKTRSGGVSVRRVWKCKDCRKQFTVLVGTIFHRTHIPVRTWLFLLFDMCAAKNGMSAREVARKYELSEEAAWFALHRLREAMKRDPLAGLLRGVVQADEAYIGGDPKNRHAKDRTGKRGRATDKTPVVSLLSHDGGEVRSQVVPNVTGATLHAVIEREVDMADAELHTDSYRAYKMVAREFPAHETVDHSAGEYVRGHVTTNHVESYFAQLKRSIDGTHHHVSVEHLPRYLAEFDFRYSTRKLSDSRRMERLLGQVGGRRLTYRSCGDST